MFYHISTLPVVQDFLERSAVLFEGAPASLGSLDVGPRLLAHDGLGDRQEAEGHLPLGLHKMCQGWLGNGCG